MLTLDGCRARRKRLWDAVSQPCDAFIIADPAHLVALANYDPSSFEFRNVEGGVILVLTPDRATLVGDNLLRTYLDVSHVDEIVAPTWYEGKRSAPDRRGLLVETALDVVRKIKPRRIGIEPACVPVGLVSGLREDRPDLGTIDLRPILLRMRRSKDADELVLIRRSIDAGEAAFSAALRRVEPGISEFEAYRRIADAALDRLGMQAPIYGDFVSGSRTEKIGGPPSLRTIERGDLFLMDMSVVVHGYRGDFANTFVVGDRPSDRHFELCEICLEALKLGEAKLGPGVPARDVDQAVRGFLNGKHAGRYPSHAGHGVGLGHPEAPFIVPESVDILEVGDVVALEPGQYVDGFGGMRYERNYLITPTGFETLAHHELRIDQ